MNKPLAIAAVVCAMLAAFAYGVSVGRHQTPPFELLRAAKQMVFPPPLPHESWGPAYRRRLSQFRSLPASSAVVMLGDSITTEAEWGELLPDIRVADRAIGGDTSAGVLARLGEILEASPEMVFLMIGLNDLDHGIPAETVAANIETILSDIHASGVTPVFQSTLFVGPDRDDHTNEQIAQINTAVSRFCLRAGIPFIDLNARLAPEGHLAPRYTLDGVHLTGEGYAAWAEEVRKHVAYVEQRRRETPARAEDRLGARCDATYSREASNSPISPAA